MAGNCIRHPEILASDLVLRDLMHGRAQQGRPRQSYLSMLLKEVGTNSKEKLRTLMRDRDIWRGLSGVNQTQFRHCCKSVIAYFPCVLKSSQI